MRNFTEGLAFKTIKKIISSHHRSLTIFKEIFLTHKNITCPGITCYPHILPRHPRMVTTMMVAFETLLLNTNDNGGTNLGIMNCLHMCASVQKKKSAELSQVGKHKHTCMHTHSASIGSLSSATCQPLQTHMVTATTWKSLAANFHRQTASLS